MLREDDLGIPTYDLPFCKDENSEDRILVFDIAGCKGVTLVLDAGEILQIDSYGSMEDAQAI